MNLTATQKLNRFTGRFFSELRLHSNGLTFFIIVSALLAFEIFNFSSTDFALRDILGGQGIGLLTWSTILALAFCGMDFAGIARLLTPQAKDNANEPGGWFLLGAWVLAGAMNAGLTWWGISVAVYNQPVDNALIMDPMTYVTVVPVVVALMVWSIRILIIGALVTSFSKSSEGARQAVLKAQNQSIGFKPHRQPVPAGYQPFSENARAQNSN
jgi:hypothetical protein